VNAGLQTVGLLADGLDGITTARQAAELDVEVVPIQRYARSTLARDGVQLGFAAVPTAEISRGLQALARILDPARFPRRAAAAAGGISAESAPG
jgi:DNA-binding transcriptional MocR family regulator